MRSSATLALLLLGCASSPAPSEPAHSEPQPSEPAPSPRASAPALASASAAAQGPTPVDGSLPSEARQKLPAHVHCGHLSCAKGGIVVPPTPRVDEASPASMWTMSLPSGERAQIDRRPGLTLYGVVTAGDVLIDGRDAKTWTGLRTTAGVILKATRDAHLVLAWVSDGRPLTEASEAPTNDLGAYPKVQTIDYRSRADLAIAGGATHVRIGFDDGPASLQVMLASVDAPVPLHDHASSWEVIGLLTAHGVFRQGPALRTTDEPAALHIPPGTTHGWAPEGDTPLLAVQLYVPPGPEQRFKKLAQP